MAQAPIFDNDLNIEAPSINLDDKSLTQICVTELQIGMYVEALDKPWSESQFILRGFFIRSEQDIEDLRRECRFVTVDASIKPTTQRQNKTARFPLSACGQ